MPAEGRAGLGGVAHLTRRFFESLRNTEPDPHDERWFIGLLSPKELSLYRAMSRPDRRHAVTGARAAETLLGDDATAELVVAAGLHDVGKTPASLGTLGRLVATVVVATAGRHRVRSWVDHRGMTGRIGQYADHPVVGAAMLSDAGASEAAVRWASEHHEPVTGSSFAPEVAIALAAADRA